MSYKTNGRNGQHDEYIFHEKDSKTGAHEHLWYDSKTGVMGGHGEYTSSDDKRWLGERSKNDSSGRGYTMFQD